MNRKNTTASPLLRALGGLAGLVLGGFSGAAIMVAAMIFTRESLGFGRILPGGLAGAGVGLLLGLCYPRAIGQALADLISGL